MEHRPQPLITDVPAVARFPPGPEARVRETFGTTESENGRPVLSGLERYLTDRDRRTPGLCQPDRLPAHLGEADPCQAERLRPGGDGCARLDAVSDPPSGVGRFGGGCHCAGSADPVAVCGDLRIGPLAAAGTDGPVGADPAGPSGNVAQGPDAPAAGDPRRGRGRGPAGRRPNRRKTPVLSSWRATARSASSSAATGPAGTESPPGPISPTRVIRRIGTTRPDRSRSRSRP